MSLIIAVGAQLLAKEGDVITLAVTVDSSGAKERRKNIERLMDDLFE